MYNWEKSLIAPNVSVRKVLEVMSESCLQVALVVDPERRLLGTVTDGDIRRAILKDMDLNGPVSTIMFTACTTASENDSREDILTRMRSMEIRQIPILDDNRSVVGLKLLMDMVDKPKRDNRVVLMAGGLGSRLQPLTNECPKPLLKVGGKPILETIMQSFIEHGFHSFHISVNYKAEMIELYFGDGSRWGVTIDYLRETEKLGTAGCLSLFPTRPLDTFLVMNGDLLTRVNFEQMLAFHHENRAMATMGIRKYDFQVPFGVVEVDNHRLISLQEKPLHQFFVNAGVYAFQPEVLDCIQPDTPMDMPELFQRLMDKGEAACTFPIHEYWLDIGRTDDYDRANGEYRRHFTD